MASKPTILMDGVRKHLVYYADQADKTFSIMTVVPGDFRAAYGGAPLSGYGRYIYKLYTMWGTGVRVGFFDYLDHKS